MKSHRAPFGPLFAQLFSLLLVFAGAQALAQADPPAHVGSLSAIEGSVVFAPPGQTEWAPAVLNRPVTPGDRLWTDAGGRAEVHLGAAVLHLDDESFLEVIALDHAVFRARLHEGSLNIRVRELPGGENFQLDTPQLAFRAQQPGEYRLDVDPARGTTSISVRSGMAIVEGANGQQAQLLAGQQLAFAGQGLDQAASAGLPPRDGFDNWAAERNSREDQSISARFVPRDVVGYAQLDQDGAWAHDPAYGAIWYPTVAAADWAPYRYGQWEWIAPWGWTWIDHARWGFAPFHYGRWAQIGSRWAWVPGRLGPRPVYAPALVAFVGGSGGSHLSLGSGPGIGWYPLAPGEVWRPAYPASPRYLRGANRFAGGGGPPVHHRRPEAITAVRIDDFSRGRPVHRHWQRPHPQELARGQLIAPPARGPQRQLPAEQQARPPAPQRQWSPPVAATPPAPVFAPPAREPRQPQPPIVGSRMPDTPWPQLRPAPGAPTRGEAEDPRAQHERERAQREHQMELRRLQREQHLGSQQFQQLQLEQQRPRARVPFFVQPAQSPLPGR